jgi:UDP-N-acetylglucosamine 4,6-dehydratase
MSVGPVIMLRDFEPANLDLDGKSILVTGGTGSFGRAFVKFVLSRCKPKRLCIYSRDELKQHEMALDFKGQGDEALRFFIGDVRDETRLRMAMRDIDIVIHAAALKHVSIAEYNPFECIKTNVLGAENVVRAAIDAHVKHVIALSTDKAANPVNLYGASKLASDKIFIAANHFGVPTGTAFSVVRYGNVSGSRGSVIPKFHQLIANGATTLPITDERMTRFWITLSQGVRFVLSSLSLMRGGEIFVPKAPSVRIVDIARTLAPGLKIEVVGIQPGEKLHELLITDVDARTTHDLGDRYVIEPAIAFWDHNAWSDEKKAARVCDNFVYASDTNEEWLSGELLASIIKGEVGAEKGLS